MFGAIVLVAMALVVIYYYPLLPDPMPSHFDMRWNVDGWMRKDSFLILMGLTLILPYLLFTFLPFVDPLRNKIEPRFKTVLLIRDVLLVFLSILLFLILKGATEGKLNPNMMMVALGFLFILLGNYMPKFPQNWFIGIRTPWTMSSEVVWRKTHILGGWLFILSGAVFIVYGLLNIGSIVPFAIIIFTALFSVVYSFYVFKKVEKQGKTERDKS